LERVQKIFWQKPKTGIDREGKDRPSLRAGTYRDEEKARIKKIEDGESQRTAHRTKTSPMGGHNTSQGGRVS